MKKQRIISLALALIVSLAGATFSFGQFSNLGSDKIYTLRDYCGINTASPDATLHVYDADNTKPAVLISYGSSDEGDIAVPVNNDLNIGTWNNLTQEYTDRLIVQSDGDVKMTRNLMFTNTSTGDKISLYEDRIGNANMYGLGVESMYSYFRSYGGFRFYSNHVADNGASSVFSIKPDGRVGVGTDDPSGELTVESNTPAMVLRDNSGNNSPNAARIELAEYANGEYDYGAFMQYDGASNKLLFGTKENGSNANILVLNRDNLSVGIGTQSSSPGFRLMVNGKIRAKEIVVETGWADYVFEEDYELRSLEEVEAFISANGHLPDVPAAQEVEENGVSVGEMESILLRKVEELTLYMIELKKENEALKATVETLRQH